MFYIIVYLPQLHVVYGLYTLCHTVCGWEGLQVCVCVCVCVCITGLGCEVTLLFGQTCHMIDLITSIRAVTEIKTTEKKMRTGTFVQGPSWFVDLV